MSASKHVRHFKTRWFARAARKAGITEGDLCRALQQIGKGLVDDLGGGVFKKRLNKNMHRGIILAKGTRCYVCVYLFAKRDRSNISDAELASFREIAASYEKLTDQQIARLLRNRELTEVCCGH